MIILIVLVVCTEVTKIFVIGIHSTEIIKVFEQLINNETICSTNNMFEITIYTV